MMQETEVTVRFCETDALGHINNTSYFIYLEEARMKFFESLGYSMSHPNEWNFIIASTKCDFLNQGYFNQILTVRTFVTKIGSKSFEINHDIICSQTGQLIAKGNAIIVFFDFKEQKSKPIPHLLREELKSYFMHN
jgi:acyl-CoA thioester hydrolase